MKRPLVWALLTALPIEAVNLAYAAPTFDLAFSVNGAWFVKLVTDQNLVSDEWMLLHLPALIAFRWVTESTSLRLPFEATLFAGGYLTTASLLASCLLGAQGDWPTDDKDRVTASSAVSVDESVVSPYADPIEIMANKITVSKGNRGRRNLHQLPA